MSKGIQKDAFVDEFLDRLYINGTKDDDGRYVLTRTEAETSAKEMFDFLTTQTLIKEQ